MTTENFKLPAEVFARLQNGEHPLRVLREWRGYGLKEFNKIMATGRDYLGQVERGKYDGSVEMWVKIAETLDVPLPVFFMGSYWKKYRGRSPTRRQRQAAAIEAHGGPLPPMGLIPNMERHSPAHPFQSRLRPSGFENRGPKRTVWGVPPQPPKLFLRHCF